MRKIKISVILPTNRPKGLEVTFAGLSRQTLPMSDWELILIDDYKPGRLKEVTALWPEGLQGHYLLGKTNYWRSNRLIANARNTGLILAKGELVVFIDDYVWVPPRFLESHWTTYLRSGYNVLGGMQARAYSEEVHDNVDKLPPPKKPDDYHEVREKLRGWDTPEQQERSKTLDLFWVTDARGPVAKKNCGGGWFYCCNASAPLSKLIEINGFDEEFDLTSEEDIDLGVRLERVGCKFWYIPDRDCTAFHMEHTSVDRLGVSPERYKKVTYDELRRRGKLDSEPDEVQLVLKEKYNTQYDGSWGLLEKNKRRSPYANIVDGKKIFNLREERKTDEVKDV